MAARSMGTAGARYQVIVADPVCNRRVKHVKTQHSDDLQACRVGSRG